VPQQPQAAINAPVPPKQEFYYAMTASGEQVRIEIGPNGEKKVVRLPQEIQE
jgi:hypothetical protein